MERIDLEKWPRKTHFEYFDRAAYPYIDLTVQADITPFYQYVKSRGHKFFPSLIYCLVKAVNEVEEFKIRILPDGVVRYKTIHADITVPIEGERFAFCRIEYAANARDFFANYERATAEAMKQTGLVPNDWFDVLWITCNPWVSFTAMSAPTADPKFRSVPLVIVGKYYESDAKMMLPLGFKVHHALIDGIHIGKFFERVESSFHHPEKIFEP